MMYRPKRINHAWWIIPTTLIVLAILCFIGVSYWSFPRIVFRPLFYVFAVAAIFFASRYALQGWEYGLTEPEEGKPVGNLQVFMVRGKRNVTYADLDLSMALSLIPESEDKALGDEGKRPAFVRTYSFVLNMFPRDVYYLYIRFREGNIRLRLELGDATFLCALQSRILEAAKQPKAPQHTLHDPGEEDYGDEAEAEVAPEYDPADAVDLAEPTEAPAEDAVPTSAAPEDKAAQ